VQDEREEQRRRAGHSDHEAGLIPVNREGKEGRGGRVSDAAVLRMFSQIHCESLG